MKQKVGPILDPILHEFREGVEAFSEEENCIHCGERSTATFCGGNATLVCPGSLAKWLRTASGGELLHMADALEEVVRNET